MNVLLAEGGFGVYLCSGQGDRLLVVPNNFSSDLIAPCRPHAQSTTVHGVHCNYLIPLNFLNPWLVFIFNGVLVFEAYVNLCS